MAGAGLHLYGPLAAADRPLVLADAAGPVHLCALPYADPAEVRLHVGDDAVHAHDAAVRAQARRLRAALPAGARSVAVGHCWVTGGSSSESERPLTVGGTGEVRADCFAGFDYTALGHLHRPQQVGEGIHYAGSLLKYSFSEAGHAKSVTLVEMDADGAVRTERIALSPRRDLRVVEGALDELLAGPPDGASREDYLLVRLTDRRAILDAMGKLREVYPNVLHLERPGLQAGPRADAAGRDHRTRSELELFRAFHREVTGDDLLPGGAEALGEVVESLRRAEREDVP